MNVACACDTRTGSIAKTCSHAMSAHGVDFETKLATSRGFIGNLEPGTSALRWLLGDDATDRLSATSSPSNHLSADGPGSRLGSLATVNPPVYAPDLNEQPRFWVAGRRRQGSPDFFPVAAPKSTINSFFARILSAAFCRSANGHFWQCYQAGVVM